MERRDFIRSGVLTTAAITGLGQASTLCGEVKGGYADGCRVTEAEAEIRLYSPAFNLSRATAVGLCARACRNNLTGRTIQLGGGPELEVDLDAAEQRVWIIGWKRALSHAQSSDCNRDPGYQRGHASPAFDDSKWRAMVNLTVGEESSDSFTWGRTHAAIPAGAREKPLSLTIGGFGLFDHRFMRVFINGDEVATRRATGRWHEPLTIDLGLGSK